MDGRGGSGGGGVGRRGSGDIRGGGGGVRGGSGRGGGGGALKRQWSVERDGFLLFFFLRFPPCSERPTPLDRRRGRKWRETCGCRVQGGIMGCFSLSANVTGPEGRREVARRSLRARGRERGSGGGISMHVPSFPSLRFVSAFLPSSLLRFLGCLFKTEHPHRGG